MQLNEERAPGGELAGPSQMREMEHLPKQVTGFYDKGTERALLQLCGVLRRIAEHNIEEMERAA